MLRSAVSIPVGTGWKKQLGGIVTKLSFLIQNNFRVCQVAITGAAGMERIADASSESLVLS
jgi:hypothetical protein